MSRMKMTIVGLYKYNKSIFNGLSVPNGVNKDNLILNILEQAGDFPLLYPDWDFMRTMITVWAANELPVWEKLQETTTVEYSPIENYDRYDSIERQAESTGQGINTGSQTAFNVDAFRDTNRNINTATDSGTESTTVHSHGNIGVTSTMELLEQQREVVQFTVQDFITKSFINRFCIELY